MSSRALQRKQLHCKKTAIAIQRMFNKPDDKDQQIKGMRAILKNVLFLNEVDLGTSALAAQIGVDINDLGIKKES